MTRPEPEADPEAASAAEPESESESETEPEPEPEAEPEPEPEPEPQSEPESEAEPEPESEAEPEPGARLAAQAVRQREIDSLTAFLNSDPSTWQDLAPRLVDAVGPDRLQEIVANVRSQIGGFTQVIDSPAGLVLVGPAGRVLAWAQVDADGVLDSLWLTLQRPRRRVPMMLHRGLFRIAFGVLAGYSAFACWSATSWSTWLGQILGVASWGLLFEWFGAPATHPRWWRLLVRFAVVGSCVSMVRIAAARPPIGNSLVVLGFAAFLLLVVVVLLVRARRYRVGTATDETILFPLPGEWYVGQGGGRGLNHHLGAPDQIGALDLVQVGRGGTHRGDPRRPESYYAYGATILAPCSGRVISASDGLADQVPGRIRMAPAFGNHVFIDTGTEVLRLAHLRPGTVAVRAGDDVSLGQFLGEVGNSGNSTEPHLHIDAVRDGRGLDLIFSGLRRPLYRGLTISGPEPAPQVPGRFGGERAQR